MFYYYLQMIISMRLIELFYYVNVNNFWRKIIYIHLNKDVKLIIHLKKVKDENQNFMMK